MSAAMTRLLDRPLDNCTREGTNNRNNEHEEQSAEDGMGRGKREPTDALIRRTTRIKRRRSFGVAAARAINVMVEMLVIT